MKRVNFAVLGCGQRGTGMAPVLANVPGAHISALCDPYIDKAESLAATIKEKCGCGRASYI